MIYVVINKRHGGFGLSDEALTEYKKRANITGDISDYDIPRDDEHLVAIVDEMGANADGRFSYLRIVEVPDDANWYIEEYDGMEWVAERHRTWG